MVVLEVVEAFFEIATVRLELTLARKKLMIVVVSMIVDCVVDL